MSYSFFAQYYDELTSNVEYPRRAEYLLKLMERLRHGLPDVGALPSRGGYLWH